MLTGIVEDVADNFAEVVRVHAQSRVNGNLVLPGERFPTWHTLNGANESIDGLARVDERAAARSGAGHARTTQLPLDVPVHDRDLLPQGSRGPCVATLLRVARLNLEKGQRRLEPVREIAGPLPRAPHKVFLPRQQLIEVVDERSDFLWELPLHSRVEAAVNAVQLLSDRVQWAQREARLDPYPKRQREADDAERDDGLAFKRSPQALDVGRVERDLDPQIVGASDAIKRYVTLC